MNIFLSQMLGAMMNKSFGRFSSACLLAVFITISNGAISGQQPTKTPAASAQNGAPASTQGAQPVLERNVRAEMGFLASDALQGRGSGTGYERLAAEYIGSQFQQFGLEPAGDTLAPGTKGFVQRVSLETLKYKQPPVLRATGGGQTHNWQYGRDLLITFLTTPGAAGALQVIDADGAPAKGSVVAVRFAEGADRKQRQALMTRAFEAGAVAVVLPESETNKKAREAGDAKPPELPARFHSDASKGSAGQPSFVVLTMRQEAFAELAALPAGTGVEFGGETEATEIGATWNAVGVLRGSDPKATGETIILSAHLDHLGVGEPVNGDAIYNGADDDASGCIAVLELARALASGAKPLRTVYFVCFGSEEKGGFGARYFIEHSPVPLERIVANLEFEMIGRPDRKVPADTLWLTGYDRSNLGRELARQGARLVADPHPEQNFFQRSDNYTLALRGVVAHTVSSFGLHTDYHRPSDEAAKIDFKLMTSSIGSMIEPVRWLANSTFRPAWIPGGAPKRN
jgi:aminopeptidase YwaD